jgi:hypothetical protein
MRLEPYTIFVSLCSYRDPLLYSTVMSLIQGRCGRNRIVIGIFEQIVAEDSLPVKYPDIKEAIDAYENNTLRSVNGGPRPAEIIYKRIDPQYSNGAGWARAINQYQLSPDEYDLLYQIDSHMLFDKDWDRTLISDYEDAIIKYNTKKVIITAPCKWYDVLEDNSISKGPELYYEGTKDISYRATGHMLYYMTNAFVNGYIISAHGQIDPIGPGIRDAFHICAGNTVFPSQWVRDVGNNIEIHFEGEEQWLSLASFAAGYQLCHPKEIVTYHYMKSGNYITKVWFEQVVSNFRRSHDVLRSIAELSKLITTLPEDVLKRFYEYSGIDYINKTVDQRALHPHPPFTLPPKE